MCLQRLFSTFANGWPGAGLLLQRILIGSVLIQKGFACLLGASLSPLIVPETVGAIAGAFLLVGLWTPVAGALVAITHGWILWSHAGNSVVALTLAVLGATLSMIGPGAWSIDARLFGRRHIEASKP